MRNQKKKIAPGSGFSTGRWFAYGVGLYVVGAGAGYFFSRSSASPPPPPTSMSSSSSPLSSSERKKTFGRIAQAYDSSISFDEFMMNMKHKRFSLLHSAQGSVLEVAAGTGRNIELYDKNKVTKLEMIDFSEEMKEQADAKLSQLDFFLRRKMKYSVMRMEDLQYPSGSFDYVVDTFGLCSAEDPSLALQEMKRVCKDGGKILLLEHGISNYSLINSYLDKNLKSHVAQWGCYWNRNIPALVKDLNLEVVEYRRFHLGTTHYIVLRVPPPPTPSSE